MNKTEKQFIKHILPEQPRRPKELKNLTAFKQFIIFPYSVNISGFPCLLCSGVGIIIDPQEIPDVIEGHRSSKRIKCTQCEGNKTSNSKEFRSEYKRRIDKWRHDLLIWKILKDDIDDLMYKLSDDDMELIVDRMNPMRY